MHEPSSPDLALEAVRAWYESKRSRKGNVNTNVTCVGLAVAELLKKNFPLTDDVVKSEKGSQVRGLSGSMVSRVLKEHGERQEFTSEGGRTSRGSLPTAQELAALLNDMFADGLDDGEREHIALKIQRFS